MNGTRGMIHQITLQDLKSGNGSTAQLTAGGPGFNYTKIHMKSARNHGYNFIIDIYGN